VLATNAGTPAAQRQAVSRRSDARSGPFDRGCLLHGTVYDTRVGCLARCGPDVLRTSGSRVNDLVRIFEIVQTRRAPAGSLGVRGPPPGQAPNSVSYTVPCSKQPRSNRPAARVAPSANGLALSAGVPAFVASTAFIPVRSSALLDRALARRSHNKPAESSVHRSRIANTLATSGSSFTRLVPSANRRYTCPELRVRSRTRGADLASDLGLAFLIIGLSAASRACTDEATVSSYERQTTRRCRSVIARFVFGGTWMPANLVERAGCSSRS